MTNFKKSLLAVAAVAAISGNANADDFSYYFQINNDLYSNIAPVEFLTQDLITQFEKNNNQVAGNADFTKFVTNHAGDTIKILVSVGAPSEDKILKAAKNVLNDQSSVPGNNPSNAVVYISLNSNGDFVYSPTRINQSDLQINRTLSVWGTYEVDTSTLDNMSSSLANLLRGNAAWMAANSTSSAAYGGATPGAVVPHTSVDVKTGQIIADSGWTYVAKTGKAYTNGAFGNYQLVQTIKALDVSKMNAADIRAAAQILKPVFDINSASGANTRAAAKDLYDALMAQANAVEAAANAAKVKKSDDHVNARTRKTNATVAGAIAINALIAEFTDEYTKEYGAGFSASVGGNFENPELKLGVSVDLQKHLGEDFEGVSVNAGWGVESGELSVGARKSWKVAEYVQTSVGASIGAEGVRVGPEVMFGNSEFGVGVAMWGPLPIPQIKVFGYTASVVPHLALANAVVGVSTIAYKAIRSEMKEAAVETAAE